MNYRHLIARAILVFVGFHLMWAQLAAQLPSSSGQQTPITVPSVCGVAGTYDQLTDPWRYASVPQDIPLGTAPIELTIQTTEFRDQPVPEKIASVPDFCLWNAPSIGVYVSTGGELFSFARGDDHRINGVGGDGKLPAGAFARLESLMDDLPDDGRRVPPPERRVFVIVQRGDSPIVRIYDSGNLPDSVIEMIRLTKARIKIMTPAFQPDKVLRPEDAGNLAPAVACAGRVFLTISRDCSLAVEHDLVTKTLIVYQGRAGSQNGPVMGGSIIRVIPEFWQPDVYGGYAVGTEFSPDDRYLLVAWGARVGVLLYDTSTWEPVTDPNVFPQNLKEYLHTPDWALGVGVNEAGETVVWDWQAHRVLSKLPGLGEFEQPPVIKDRQGNRIYDIPSADIEAAEFSPDRTRVAIYTGIDAHLSIWDVESGNNLRNFWPPNSILSPSGKPLWWNNGKWLLAGQGNGKGIWDATTGHFLGTLDLSGCEARDALVMVDERLRQHCFDGNSHPGNVLEWSQDRVQKQLDAFVAQVSNGETPLK